MKLRPFAVWPTRPLRHPANVPCAPSPLHFMAGKSARRSDRPGRTPRVTLQRSSTLSGPLARPSISHSHRPVGRTPDFTQRTPVRVPLESPHAERLQGRTVTVLSTRVPHGGGRAETPPGVPGSIPGMEVARFRDHPLARKFPLYARNQHHGWAEEGSVIGSSLKGSDTAVMQWRVRSPSGIPDLRALPDHPTQMSSSSQDFSLPTGGRWRKSTHLLHPFHHQHAGFF
jgi:hypothetical protein